LATFFIFESGAIAEAGTIPENPIATAPASIIQCGVRRESPEGSNLDRIIASASCRITAAPTSPDFVLRKRWAEFPYRACRFTG
jgi:hypothetical protein